MPEKQPELSSSKMEVYRPVDMTPEEFRQKLSDHFSSKAPFFPPAYSRVIISKGLNADWVRPKATILDSSQ